MKTYMNERLVEVC